MAKRQGEVQKATFIVRTEESFSNDELFYLAGKTDEEK
jgi:hypothetical protein